MHHHSCLAVIYTSYCFLAKSLIVSQTLPNDTDMWWSYCVNIWQNKSRWWQTYSDCGTSADDITKRNSKSGSHKRSLFVFLHRAEGESSNVRHFSSARRDSGPPVLVFIAQLYREGNLGVIIWASGRTLKVSNLMKSYFHLRSYNE